MRRPPSNFTDAPGSDSFLDVVTNIVGILIILVMVVGMRAKNAPPEEIEMESEIDSALVKEVQSLSGEAAAVQEDIHRLHGQATAIQQELALQEAGRNHLSLIVAMAEKDLNERKAKLDGQRQRQFEQQSQLAVAHSALDEIQHQIAQASAERPAAVEVKAFHRPISKTVYGKEIHFQLSGGRVAYIPIEELFELARDETRASMTRVSDLTNRVMVVGPKQGFEMRYTVEVSVDRRQGQMAIRSKEWEVVPVQSRLGELTQEALGNDSNFRRVLSRYSPQDTTITLWTYPDSFADYRALNEELHRLGYAAAGRPLPKGFPIGGSPHGSKSAAQ
ncbi:MAG: hypothetical protein WD894_05340 [Pirellulales bacterium]